MIKSKYKILFGLEVLHTYFENNLCNCLQFKPDNLTASLIKKFGFNIRSKVNGIDFYYNSESPISEMLNYIANVTGLEYVCINIITTDQGFSAFTDIPTDWLGQLVFDSQSGSNKNQDGIVLLEKLLSPQQGPNDVGYIKIHFEDILKYRDNGSVIFQINFTARSTQWNYYIINKSALQLNNPSITGKILIDFEGPENVTIPSGQQALLFSSGNNLIPLSETPMYVFDLINNPKQNNEQGTTKKTSGKVIFKGLPNPDPEKIECIVINNKNQVISPMYVYL